MRNIFYEFLVVLSYSKRTQWAICLGVVSFFSIHLLGYHSLNNFQFQGPMSGLVDMIKLKMLKYYDREAIGGLLSFWYLAIKYYRRDRRRYFDIL